MLNDKIEFYGEMLTISAISHKIGTSIATLQKHYKETGNIYEAERICKDIIKQREKSLIDYNGEKLTIHRIAKKMELKPDSLKVRFEQLGDIYKAVEECLEARKQIQEARINYNNEKISIYAIAQKNGLKHDTLKKKYEQMGNIYKAVESCLKLKENAEESKLDYNGEKLTLTEIARRVGIGRTSLRKYYSQTGDVYQAIEKYREKQQEYENLKVEYKGKRTFIGTIAKEEGIEETTLAKDYKKYGNIEKAVYMGQMKKKRAKKIKVRNGYLGISDLSIILGIKESELRSMLNSGMSIEDIKKQKVTKTRSPSLKHEILKMPNGQTLLEYCIENGYNFRCIYYSINTYGKSIEEAIEEYRKNGQTVPKQWIFEKYGLLLKHLLLQNKVNSQRIIAYMRNENISINDAIEEYVLRRNCRNHNLDYEWVHELYGVISDENMTDEYEDFKRTFYVSENEEDCVLESHDEIEKLQRTLLLYDISEALREKLFNETEEEELLKLYNITDKEVETIFIDLYNGFGNKISLSEPQQKRRTVIADITEKWYYMTEEKRTKALEQANISSVEKKNIEDLSRNIVKYQRKLHIDKTKKMEGVNLNGD